MSDIFRITEPFLRSNQKWGVFARVFALNVPYFPVLLTLDIMPANDIIQLLNVVLYYKWIVN